MKMVQTFFALDSLTQEFSPGILSFSTFSSSCEIPILIIVKHSPPPISYYCSEECFPSRTSASGHFLILMMIVQRSLGQRMNIKWFNMWVMAATLYAQKNSLRKMVWWKTLPNDSCNISRGYLYRETETPLTCANRERCLRDLSWVTASMDRWAGSKCPPFTFPPSAKSTVVG